MITTDTGSIGEFGRNLTYGLVLVIEMVLVFVTLRLVANSLRRNRHD